MPPGTECLWFYEWVLANRKKWLEDGAKIPDMSDIGGLVWIDQELAKKELEPARKATLEVLQKKAEDGELRRKGDRFFIPSSQVAAK